MSSDSVILKLPSDLLLQAVVGGPLSGSWLWEHAGGPITVVGTGAISHAEPVALAALAAWADHQRARGIPISVDESLKSPYAWKFGLLSSLAGHTAPPTIIEGFLPPTAVRRDEERASLLRSVSPLLHLATEAQRAVVMQCLTETLRNVVEHAKSDLGAYVCCSHFPAVDRVSIAVVDTGIGVPTTIRRRYPGLTDTQAIEAAVQWRVTGVRAEPVAGGSSGLAQNFGAGLYYVRGMAVHTGGLFTLASDGAYVGSDRIENINGGSLGARWKGTIVAISFRPSRANEGWESTQDRPSNQEEFVAWGLPEQIKRVEITPTVGGFVEDKEQANRLREEVILPELRKDSSIGIDLSRAQLVTHSFVHALLYEAIRLVGARATELIHVKAKERQVKDMIRIVGRYALEDSSERSY